MVQWLAKDYFPRMPFPIFTHVSWCVCCGVQSFPCVGHSTYALLWKRKYLANPQVVERLKDIKEDDYWHAARSLR